MQFFIFSNKKLWQSVKTKWLILALALFNRQHLQAALGMLFKYAFKKGDIECTIEYKITGNFPIEIKRTYPDGSTELIVLQKPQLENAKAFYNLAKGSSSILEEKKIPGILRTFGKSEQKTANEIKEMFSKSQRTGRLDLFIFFKGRKDDKLRIIGHVAWHSYNNYKPGSIDGMYWRGIYELTWAKGIAGLATEVLFSHAVAIGLAKHLVLVMDKKNIKSINIAKRLQMKQIDSKNYKTWGYSQKKEDVYIYGLSAKEWKDIHWKKKLCKE